MLVVSMILLFSPLVLVDAQTEQSAMTQPAAPVSESAIATGPLRVELVAILEGRYRYFDATVTERRDPEMRMQLRVAGEAVGQIVRYGNAILDEMTDETGKSLVKPEDITPEKRIETRLSTQPPDRLRASGLLLVANGLASERAATRIQSIRGSVRVALATGFDEVTVVNPVRYAGALIENPRLAALGIEIDVMKPEDMAEPYDPVRAIALHVRTKSQLVRSVKFFDGWMKPIRSRSAAATSRSQASCTVYTLSGDGFNEDTQLVIEFFPEIQEQIVPIELKDVQLP